MSARKSTGKRLRFSVFARDNFTCRYCGKQSDSVELQVDHLIPVCQGGTNDESNLVTSCVPCNQGKSGKLIEQAVPNETDRLRMAQELNEQLTAAGRAKALISARKIRREEMVSFITEQTGRPKVDPKTADVLFSYVEQFGEEMVYDWIEKASSRTWSDPNLGRYVSGIRRSVLAQEEPFPDPNL
jgi:hypothetical protein